ncbi:MAG: hypothetical protein JXA94_00910 [Parachlamydiales bacterium]|nr:hypothetical protein [Parachlamydiales bacterium]
MGKKTFHNLINGEKVCLSGKYFDSNSFFSNYSIESANSGAFDIAISISKAKSASNDLSKITLEERKNIASSMISDDLFDDDLLNHLVILSGTPLTFIKKQINDLKKIFSNQIREIFKNYEYENDFFLEKNSQHKTYYTPKKGISYAVLPFFSIRAIGIILPISILLGIPLIIKTNPVVSPLIYKILEKLHSLNYPKNAVNIISFDEKDPSSIKKHENLIENCDIIWTFGDDNNFRYKNLDSSAHIDLFSSKTAIRHPYNNCSALVCNNINVNKTIELILESSISLPHECMSLKSLYIVEECYKEIKDRLIERFNELNEQTGNLLNETTLVGYTENTIIQSATNRFNDLEKSSLIKILNDRNNSFISNENIFLPILMETNDDLLDIFNNPFPVISLVLKKCKNIEDGISLLNNSVSQKRLSVTFFGQIDNSNLFNKELIKTNAIHLRINSSSLKIDLLNHDGNDYFRMLTDIKKLENYD